METVANLFFCTECNSKKSGLSYFHYQQVDLTCKYAKEIFKWNRMLNL